MSRNVPATSVPTLSGFSSVVTGSCCDDRSEVGVAPAKHKGAFTCLGRCLDMGWAEAHVKEMYDTKACSVSED